MRRFTIAIVLALSFASLPAGCGYYEEYREMLELKQRYDRAVVELKAAKDEIERLKAENSELREKLERYAEGVKKMYE